MITNTHTHIRLIYTSATNIIRTVRFEMQLHFGKFIVVASLAINITDPLFFFRYVSSKYTQFNFE